MTLGHIVCSTAFLLALAQPATADVRDNASGRAFSLASGSPSLVLPKDGWTIQQERRRQGDTAVYYLLSHERSKLSFSVYIDKTTECQSAADCLQSALKNSAYREAKELSEFEAGSFKAVQFFLDQPNKPPIKQAHVLAAAYVDGQWFDVHISKADRERPDMGPLVEFLKTVVLR